MMPTETLRIHVLAQASLLYARADLEWRRAASSARALFPAQSRPRLAPIGDPHSHVRRLWDARARALARMIAARAALERARARRRRMDPPGLTILLLPAP
jgi:hypothetical protein